jgi:hypothetical protein
MASLPESLTLEVATPLGKELSLQTDSVQVPSVQGDLSAYVSSAAGARLERRGSAVR